MMNNLEGMPEKFRMELDDMSNLYGSIQDLRIFKENYDALLLNKFRRNAVGRIDAHYHWPKVANYMIQELEKMKPSVDDQFNIDISSLAALEDSSTFKVNCGRISHTNTGDNHNWQLTFENNILQKQKST